MSKKERNEALWRLVPVLLIFGAIIMGLGIGLFTPTPAAAMGVLVILLYGFISRFFSQTYLTVQKLRNSILSTAKTAGMIYFILFAADVLKGVFRTFRSACCTYRFSGQFRFRTIFHTCPNASSANRTGLLHGVTVHDIGCRSIFLANFD